MTLSLSQQLVANPPALCNIIRRIAIAAGDILLRYYDGLEDLDIQRKDDGSPVSLADQEAETYIAQELAKHTPDIPMVGEESKDAGTLPDFKNADYFWLVDPLDGTKEFLRGGENFTVNIGLIHQGNPVLGVVYVPVTGLLYAGYQQADGTSVALKWTQDTNQEKDIHVRKAPPKGLTIVASQSHGDQTRLEKLLDGFKVNKVIRKASSLKICTIAEGKADLYPRLGPTCEWDTAAAHAVLNAAGGCLTKTDGTPLTYGGADPDMLNPEFIAASENWFINS